MDYSIGKIHSPVVSPHTHPLLGYGGATPTGAIEGIPGHLLPIKKLRPKKFHGIFFGNKKIELVRLGLKKSGKN
ncbi:MAG: hypothetical protein GX999_00160 [Bacteroidales bacterium]|nr:hypothetical protein [Bacteroidales bacterium]